MVGKEKVLRHFQIRISILQQVVLLLLIHSVFEQLNEAFPMLVNSNKELPHPNYGSVERSPIGKKDGQTIKLESDDVSQEFKELICENPELEMEKLVFNCDERIFKDEHHRLLNNLERFSVTSLRQERLRVFYHRLFWVVMVVIVMLVILRVAYVYFNAHRNL